MSLVSPRHPLGLALLIMSALALIYVVAPLLVIVAASFGETGYLAFPPRGFSLDAYAKALGDRRYIGGFVTSVKIASIVTLIASAIGIAAAYALVRFPFRGSRLLESLFLSPLVLPGLVLAVALTIFFSRHPFARGSERLVLAHLVICVPCVLRVAIPAFQRFDRSLEEAAMNLGASPIVAFFLVTLPVVRPGIIAAAAVAFIMSFDEVEMAVFLASPREQPLTVALYSAVQLAFEPPLAAVSSLLIFAVIAVLTMYYIVIHMRRAT
jgi:putative spermidine/putrescine transport system permease protein